MVLLPIQFAVIRLIIFLAAKHPIFSWLKQQVHDEEDLTATFSNAAQRLVLETFYELLISSWLSFHIVKNHTASDNFAMVFGYLCIALCVGIVFFAIYFILIKSHPMTDSNRRYLAWRENFSRQKTKPLRKIAKEEVTKIEPYGALWTEGVRKHSRAALCFNLLFLLRVCVFVSVSFLLMHYGVLQVIIVSTLSMITAIYLIEVLPFEAPSDNVLNIINECGTLIICLCIYAYTGDYQSA